MADRSLLEGLEMTQRLSRNVALNLTLTLILITPAIFAAPPTEGITAPAQQIRERPASVSDQIISTAGKIVVTEVNYENGMTTKTITLSGKTIYNKNDYSLEIERVFDYPDKGTVLLLAVGQGGSACPSQYRFLSIRVDGSTSLTDEFGTCSDSPTITLSNDKITVNLPDMQGRGNEAWIYVHEDLSKARSINPKERNVPRLAFKEDEPTRVHGTIAHSQGISQDWLLKLPKPTLLDGGEALKSCHSLTESLPISRGIVIPKSGGKDDFVVTIACPASGPVITAIHLPGQAPALQQRGIKTGREVRIHAGAILCADLDSMRAMLATKNNPGAQLPDGCSVMQRSATTRIFYESTPIPGVVIVQVGSTAATVRAMDLYIQAAPVQAPVQPISTQRSVIEGHACDSAMHRCMKKNQPVLVHACLNALAAIRGCQ